MYVSVDFRNSSFITLIARQSSLVIINFDSFKNTQGCHHAQVSTVNDTIMHSRHLVSWKPTGFRTTDVTPSLYLQLHAVITTMQVATELNSNLSDWIVVLHAHLCRAHDSIRVSCLKLTICCSTIHCGVTFMMIHTSSNTATIYCQSTDWFYNVVNEFV